MVSIKGILKVKVIQGIDLVIRDISSSDPYVRLSIADHKVRTKVMNKNLNPRWDEQLTLATPDSRERLKLGVYDKDFFTADDKMGQAEIDLSSLIAAVERNESQSCQDGVTVCTIPASRDNCFAKDSHIKVKNGQLVQKVHVRLQNVEKGEIKLELMWQPYTQ